MFAACGTKEDGGAEAEASAEADTAVAEIPSDMVEQLPEGSENKPDAQLDAATDKPSEMPAVAEEKPAEEPAATTATAEPTPSEPAPVSMSGDTEEYSVRRGDTLMRIAFNIYGDITQWRSIYDMNKDSIPDSSQLTVGMKLKYNKPASEPNIEKNGEPYLIKRGDTLGTISTEIYGKPSNWKKLWENNRSLIKDPNKIYAGFYLYYQISEQERQEAEGLKGSQLGQSSAGKESTLPTTESGTAAAPAEPAAEAAPAAPTTGDAGGLQGLLPQAEDNRAPASVTPAQ